MSMMCARCDYPVRWWHIVVDAAHGRCGIAYWRGFRDGYAEHNRDMKPTIQTLEDDARFIREEYEKFARERGVR